MTENTIINMTSHPIFVVKVLEDGSTERTATFEPSGNTIRLKASIVAVGSLCGISTTKTVFGIPEGLPAFEEGYYYVVSQLVKSALPHRPDLLVPAEMVRDDKGFIIGCQSLGV
jgi:hypothetical protein